MVEIRQSIGSYTVVARRGADLGKDGIKLEIIRPEEDELARTETHLTIEKFQELVKTLSSLV